MKLRDLLEELDYELYAGELDKEISTLVYDSRKVEKDSVFVCISGTVRDAHDFIPDVIDKGASVIIIEKDVEPVDGITYIKVANSRQALAILSAAYFGHPAKELKTIGITGTKGKTTTTYMVKSILEKAGIKTGLIGTIESIVGEERIPAVNTTPESYRVQELFRQMVDAGLDAVVWRLAHRLLCFTEFQASLLTSAYLQTLSQTTSVTMSTSISQITCTARAFSSSSVR